MAGGDTQPAIYANFVVNARGFGPSPNEWADVITALYKYMESEQYSDSIDGSYASTRVDGAKKYLSTMTSIENNLPVCQDRVAVLMDFIAAMEQRMGDTLPADQRMQRPLSEVGYSRQPIARLKAHSEQHSSNFIMGLCMAVLEDTFPDEGFQLAQHIIMRVYEPHDAALGETFITALMQAYTINGGGFSHAAAGTSINSAKRVTNDSWKAFRLSLAQDEKYLQQVSLETARLKREMEAEKDQCVVLCLAELKEETKKRGDMWEGIGRTALEV